jgi:RNA polymerase sigma-70 factor (ECF subfamily)
MKSDSDESLMRRFQGGDEAAFGALFERYAPRLINFCFRVLQSRAEAEDLAQDVLVRIYLHKERFRPEAPFIPWLFTIASHLVSNVLRQRTRHPHVALERPAGEENGVDPLGSYADPRQPSPDAALAARDEARAIERAIAALPENQRIALLLLHFEDLTYAQIAEATGQSVSSVKSLLFRARKNLQKALVELNPT